MKPGCASCPSASRRRRSIASSRSPGRKQNSCGLPSPEFRRADPGPLVSTGTERISSFAVDLRWDDLPTPVVAAAKLHILDTIGCGFAARALGVGGEALSLGIEQGGRPESTAIGHETLLPAPSAALANGMLCHFLDYDDTHTASGMHVSVTVLPAALAAAQAVGASGRELVAAVIAGSEIAIRIGMAAPLEF